MPRSHLVIARAVVALLMAAVAGASAVRAASPSPFPTPSVRPSLEPAEAFEIEAWLDAPVPADAVPGSSLHIGAFAWIDGPEESVRGATFRVLLHPASGSGEPTFDYAYQDFAGHLVADIVVPDGGAGELEILLPGTVCENDVCGPRDTPILIRGVGPPPGMPLPAFATARISPPVRAIVAAEPTTIDITVEPRIRWPAPGLQLPAAMWLQVREPQGAILDDVAATLVDPAAGRYRATVTFGQEGEFVVQAAAVEAAEGADLFGSSVRRVSVEGGASAPPATAPGEGGDSPPGWMLAALVGALLAGLAIVVLGRWARRD
jgi:hypothetical protein